MKYNAVKAKSIDKSIIVYYVDLISFDWKANLKFSVPETEVVKFQPIHPSFS